MSYLVANPEDKFSRDEAHMVVVVNRIPDPAQDTKRERNTNTVGDSPLLLNVINAKDKTECGLSMTVRINHNRRTASKLPVINYWGIRYA